MKTVLLIENECSENMLFKLSHTQTALHYDSMYFFIINFKNFHYEKNYSFFCLDLA
jgi:hypothetical protein